MPVAVAAAAAVAEAATSQEAPVLQASVIACDTLRALQVPPMQRQLGPNVQHVNLRRDGLLSEVLAEELGLPQNFVLELLRFGAVYYCPVTPQANERAAPGLTAERLAAIEELRRKAIAVHGSGSQASHPKRMTEDCLAAAHGYVRAHLHPKRFPAAYSVDWRCRIIADTQTYVAVNKPAGVQVPPTVDNNIESLMACVERALGAPAGSLLNTHRLDAGTEGVVVLARSQAFAAAFSKLLRDKTHCLRKTYRCLTAQPPPVGSLVHWMSLHQRQPGEPEHSVCHDAEVPGAARAELEILSVERVQITASWARSAWAEEAFESTILLKTGRTHQIRAQLSAIGCPLLGDAMYTMLSQQRAQVAAAANGAQSSTAHSSGSALGKPIGASNSETAGGSTTGNTAAFGSRRDTAFSHCDFSTSGSGAGQGLSQDPASGVSLDWAQRLRQEDPLAPIALQAFKLEILGGEGRAVMGAEGDVAFEAGVPWWRAVD